MKCILAIAAAVLALALSNWVHAQVVISANLQYTWPAATATTVASPPSQLGSYIVLNGVYAPRPANYSITWTDAGTAPSACTFNAQGSPDNVTWTSLDGGSPIDCTTSGAEFISLSPVLYVRIYMATFTQGSSSTKVTFNYVGSPGSAAKTAGTGACPANQVEIADTPNGPTCAPSGGSGTVNPGTTGAQAGYTATGTTVGPIAQWMRQPAPAISPYPLDASQQVQETSAVLSTSPEILTGYNQVVKETWTDGWTTTTGVGICFGESPDGITPPTRSATCPLTATSGYARSWLMNDPANTGHYILYATTQDGSGHVAQFTGTTVAGLTSAHSNVIACGSNGQEASGSTGNVAVWYDTTQTPHWRMLYDCAYNGANSYADWLATSTDGVTWTKFQTAPVIGYGSGVTMGGNCSDCGGPWVGILNGKPHAYVHGGPTGNVPTPYIYHLVDTTGVGNAWVADAAPTITARTYQEGVGLTNGQIGDPFLLDMGALNQSLLFFEETPNGCPSQITCATPMYVEVAVINQPLATVVTELQSDGPASQTVGPQSSYLAGYVPPPGAPNVAGLAGQWSVQSGYLYAYDVNNTLWGRTALTETGWGLQADDLFAGTVSTLCTSHTDLLGNTYTLYTAAAPPGLTSCLLTGTNGANQPSGTATTAYASMLSSVTPSSANYVVTASFNYSLAGCNVAILGRANPSGDYTAYEVNGNCGSAVALYAIVAGAVTQIGTYTPTWTLGTNHTFALSMSGSTIKVFDNGSGSPSINVSDSTVTAKGQAGFQLSGGGTSIIDSFTVQ